MKKTRQPKHKNQPQDNLINQNKKNAGKIKKTYHKQQKTKENQKKN